MRTAEIEILLVEDNENDLELTLHAFRRHQVVNQLQVVRDGVEALDFLFCDGEFAARDPRKLPGVVLLDLKLPRVSGIEVLQRVKADPRTRAVPIVVLTSSRESPDVARCYELGANSYIVKPVDFDQFNEAVRQIGLYWTRLNQSPAH